MREFNDMGGELIAANRRNALQARGMRRAPPPASRSVLPLWIRVKATSKRDSARRSSMRTMCWYSVFSVRRNLRLPAH